MVCNQIFFFLFGIFEHSMKKSFFRILILIFLFISASSGYSATSPELLDQNLEEHIHYSETAPNLIGHIYIGDHGSQISQGTLVYIKKALEYYQTKNPIFIILELDTPGGEVFAAQKISDLLKEMDTQYGIPIVAFINNWAISAGAMLAYSSRYITVVKDASMGAAAPITQSGEATSEKVNSAIRADFANRAAFFDRDPLIAEAMVDADLVLVVREGKVIPLAENSEIKSTDQVITRKGKLLTLNAQEMMDLGVADLLLLPKKLELKTASEKEAGEWPFKKELLSTHPFFEKIPQASVVSFKMDWKTRFFTFLASPIVTSLLFLGLMIGFYIEMSTPGFGAAGIVGTICLFLIILSSFALQAASLFEFILLGVGILLILLEIFVIPGFGVTGFIGIILAFAGLFALLLPGIEELHFDFATKNFNAAGEYILERIGWLSATFVIGVIAIAILARWLVPRLRLLSPLVHRGEQEGFFAGISSEKLPKVGAVGSVVSPLRTAGKVEIEGEIYDAVSSGSFIEKGEKIRVIGIEGSKMIVEEVP